MIDLKLKPILTLLLLAVWLCMISCQSSNDPQPPSTDACYMGRWGNDYATCPISSTLTQGTGALADRKAQEMKLVFQTDSTGYFNLYDCQNKKYYDGLIRFKYRVANNEISFDWLGDLPTINVFDYRRTYQMQCRGDSLIFPELIFWNFYLYHNTRYFLRR
jgi:hypothetical protein